MTLKNLAKKILLVELVQGLAITLREMFLHPVTIQYPKQRDMIFERFRGEPHMGRDASGKTLCIACNLCAQICPEQCISVNREKNPETKKFELKGYVFDMQRCMFCGFCQEACPTNCITLTRDYELAQYDVKSLVLELPVLENGVPKSVYKK